MSIFFGAEDDLSIDNDNEIESNKLNEDIEAEDNPNYIKMDWSLETPEEKLQK